MSTKAELQLEIARLQGALEEQRAETERARAAMAAAISNLNARHERKLGEALADVAHYRREPQRLRRTRMVRVIEESATLRPGEKLILEGPVDPTEREL